MGAPRSLLLAILVVIPSTLVAQFPDGCKISTIDRTITFCTPLEGATLTENNGTTADAFIRDSLPHTTLMYVDGNPHGSGVSEQALSADVFHIDNFGPFVVGEVGWHQFTVVVFDAMGTFKNTVHFRLSGDPQCPPPKQDKTISICSPVVGARVTSPVHISAVATSSTPVLRMLIWVGGFEYARAVDGGLLGIMPNQHGKTASVYVHLKPGKHRALIKVVGPAPGFHTIEKIVDFEVVATDDCCQ